MSAKVKKSQEFTRLFKSAKPFLKRAHAPYSQFHVAAALLANDGKVYGGCNVENASYGGTICAERVAIVKAVSEGATSIRAILVMTNQKDAWPPCGFCRQVIAEFANANTKIYVTDVKQNYREYTLGELLPEAFSPAVLRRSRKG